MTARIRHNQIKGTMIIILFTVLTLNVLITQAQTYRGFEASFGTRSVTVSSDIERINNTNLMETGGQAGLVYGNKVLRSRLILMGYYASAGNTPGTTALYTSQASLNFYPLQMLMKKQFIVEPYLTSGVSYDRFKFFGYYVNQEPGAINYSQAEAPYLGKIKQVNAMAGLGLEVKLKDDFDFIHLFTEIKYAQNLSGKSGSEVFARTSLLNQIHTSIGISFGASR